MLIISNYSSKMIHNVRLESAVPCLFTTFLPCLSLTINGLRLSLTRFHQCIHNLNYLWHLIPLCSSTCFRKLCSTMRANNAIISISAFKRFLSLMILRRYFFHSFQILFSIVFYLIVFHI